MQKKTILKDTAKLKEDMKYSSDGLIDVFGDGDQQEIRLFQKSVSKWKQRLQRQVPSAKGPH